MVLNEIDCVARVLVVFPIGRIGLVLILVILFSFACRERLRRTRRGRCRPPATDPNLVRPTQPDAKNHQPHIQDGQDHAGRRELLVVRHLLDQLGGGHLQLRRAVLGLVVDQDRRRRGGRGEAEVVPERPIKIDQIVDLLLNQDLGSLVLVTLEAVVLEVHADRAFAGIFVATQPDKTHVRTLGIDAGGVLKRL